MWAQNRAAPCYLRLPAPEFCNSPRFTSTADPSCPHRPITSISFRPSAWPSTPPTPSAPQMTCSLRLHAVADQVTPEQLNLGMLFPPQSNTLEVEVQTDAPVCELAGNSGLLASRRRIARLLTRSSRAKHRDGEASEQLSHQNRPAAVLPSTGEHVAPLSRWQFDLGSAPPCRATSVV